MKRYTFYFVSGGSFSVTGHFSESDTDYIITDQLNAQHIFPKQHVLRIYREDRRR